MARRRPPRRGSYNRRARPARRNLGVAVMAAITVALVAVAVLTYASHRAGRFRNVGAAEIVAPVARQFIYTVRMADDAAITLPTAVRSELLGAGLAHRAIAMTRVSFNGEVSTSYIDMTPRTGSASQDPVLKVAGRAVPVIDAKISAIEKTINSPAAAGSGRALYVGLTKADFTSVPVTIISSGIDLTNPDNFRTLKWTVPPRELVARLKRSGALPTLHGPVTFVLVPTTGLQPQLGQAQKTYLRNMWTALLTAAGATSVRFIDANAITASSSAPSVPTVTVPGLPGTPVPQVHKAPHKVTCTLSASYFIFNTAKLTDATKTRQDLTHCVMAALAAHATFTLNGWTSYEGPLTPGGKPVVDYAYNRKLSLARVKAIANLLISAFRVPRSAITRLTGHGNVDQPNPDPRSPANRVVIITYTTK